MDLPRIVFRHVDTILREGITAPKGKNPVAAILDNDRRRGRKFRGVHESTFRTYRSSEREPVQGFGVATVSGGLSPLTWDVRWKPLDLVFGAAHTRRLINRPKIGKIRGQSKIRNMIHRFTLVTFHCTQVDLKDSSGDATEMAGILDATMGGRVDIYPGLYLFDTRTGCESIYRLCEWLRSRNHTFARLPVEGELSVLAEHTTCEALASAGVDLCRYPEGRI